MTPQQALQNLVNAAREARLTWAEHNMIAQCAAVVAAALNIASKDEVKRKDDHNEDK